MTLKEKTILTGLGRFLIYLYQKEGTTSYTQARKTFGTNIGNILITGVKEDLIDYNIDTRVIKLKPKGKKLAECLTKCIKQTERDREI